MAIYFFFYFAPNMEYAIGYSCMSTSHFYCDLPFVILDHFPLYVNAINVERVFVKFSRNKQEVRIKRGRKKSIFIEHLSKITKRAIQTEISMKLFMASFSYLPLCWSKYLRIRLFRWMKQKKICTKSLQHDDTLNTI